MGGDGAGSRFGKAGLARLGRPLAGERATTAAGGRVRPEPGERCHARPGQVLARAGAGARPLRPIHGADSRGDHDSTTC